MQRRSVGRALALGSALALALSVTLGAGAPTAAPADPAGTGSPPAAADGDGPPKAPAPGDPAATAPGAAAAPAPGAAAPALACVIPVHGEIDQVVAATFERRLDAALARDPAYIILDMDTWGGELHSGFAIADRVRKVADSVVMVAYVSEKAISAGALISLACDAIAMRPGTRLGDCEAILVQDGEMKSAPEKIKTTLRSTFRDFAEANGYPSDLAEAMVDKDHEVVRVFLAREGADLSTAEAVEAALAQARVVYAQRRKLEQWPEGERRRILREETAIFAGNLLTMNHREALDYGFCRWIVDDLDDLAAKLGAEGGRTVTTETLPETRWEGFIAFLTSGPMRSLLMFIGILGLMIEFYHPGLLVPGAVGLLCLGIAFFSGHLIGVVDVADVALIVVGFVLLGVEVFLIPGFGVVGVLGIVAVLAGCFLSLQSFTFPATAWEQVAFFDNLEVFFLGIVGTAVAFGLAVRFLPRSPVLSKLVLAGALKAEDGYTVGSPSRVALIGREGRATTALRPAGKVEVGADLLDAVSEGTFVEAGTRVVVVETDANRVVVRPAGAAASEGAA